MKFAIYAAVAVLVALSGTAMAQDRRPLPFDNAPPYVPSAPDPDAPRPTDNCHHPTEIRFGRNEDTASFTDVVLNGGARCYVFSARKGQRLHAEMDDQSSPNAVIMVFKPGWGFRPVYGVDMMDGSALRGTGRDDEATEVHTTLPGSGRYLIDVDTARGDAGGYTLRIRIR